MSKTLLADRLPTADTATTSNTPNELLQLVMPAFVSALAVSIRPTGQPMYVTYTGVDGEAVGTAVKLPLPADGFTPLDRLSGDIWVGAAVADVPFVVALAVR